MTDPISMFVPAILIAVFSAPLAFKLIPPNRFYGIRTTATLSNREVWFRANRVAGLLFMLTAAFVLVVYLLNPELASGRSLTGVLVLILPILAALGATLLYIRSLAKTG